MSMLAPGRQVQELTAEQQGLGLAALQQNRTMMQIDKLTDIVTMAPCGVAFTVVSQ
ncbi:hypothetical protein LZ645_05395 [Shewanella algae]|nr:hypothetical protein [Shewanella algae]MCE9774383.1 hypothetical protein [Shewanella algae]